MPAVQAQINPDEQTVIRQQNTHEQEKLELQATYRQQLATYRDLERQYQISVSQYFQVETLASLEKAIQDVRQTMLSRGEILNTYAKMVRLELTDTHGATIEDKKLGVDQLTALETQLTANNELIKNSQDRPSLQTRIDEFIISRPSIESNLYYSLSLIAFGKLQTVYDQTYALMSLVDERIEQRNSGVLLAEKKRASVEIKESLGVTKLSLEKIYQTAFSEKQDRQFSASSYSTMLKDLDEVYVGLLQIHNYIEEVLR